jgi:hypothetical protein
VLDTLKTNAQSIIKMADRLSSRFLEYNAEFDSGSGSWCMPGVECGVQAHCRLAAKVGGEKWQR